jgi:hypothetical protein
VVGLDARRFMQREHDALASIGLEVEDLSVQVDEPAPQRLSHESHTFAVDRVVTDDDRDPMAQSLDDCLKPKTRKVGRDVPTTLMLCGDCPYIAHSRASAEDEVVATL